MRIRIARSLGAISAACAVAVAEVAVFPIIFLIAIRRAPAAVVLATVD
jgi:hypothetical protein